MVAENDDVNEGRRCPSCKKTVLYMGKDSHVHSMLKVMGSVGTDCPHCKADVFLGYKDGTYYCATAEFVNGPKLPEEVSTRLTTGM